MEDFNNIGEALACITNYSELEQLRAKINLSSEGRVDRGELNELRAKEKYLSNPLAIAKTVGMYQDPKFLKNLSIVTNFGFSDQLEVQQSVNGDIFSSCLKRNYLRESEDLIVRKYSRNTEKKLVVLGVVTQSRQGKESTENDNFDRDSLSMKMAVTNMVNHIGKLEESMIGKSVNEVVIDPVAVYVNI